SEVAWRMAVAAGHGQCGPGTRGGPFWPAWAVLNTEYGVLSTALPPLFAASALALPAKNISRSRSTCSAIGVKLWSDVSTTLSAPEFGSLCSCSLDMAVATFLAGRS